MNVVFRESLTEKVLSEQIPLTFQINPVDIFMVNLAVGNLSNSMIFSLYQCLITLYLYNCSRAVA